MYWRPVAAAANDRKHSGSQHCHDLAVLGLRSPKWSSCQQGCSVSWKLLGRVSFLAFSSFGGLLAFHGAWSPCLFKDSHGQLICSRCGSLTWTPCLPLPLGKTVVILLGPRGSTISGSEEQLLNSTCNLPIPSHVT